MRKKILRKDMIENDLISYNPKKWRMNIPFKDYNFRIEDTVPALSGAIGKIALVAAFATAWALGYNITDPAFVTENIRLEMVFASILTIVFCAILNPYLGPPGTLSPLIPLIPIIISSGVHPLPLSILIGIIGLAISIFKYFNNIVEINGPGTKSGIILLFGFLGLNSSFSSLKSWAGGFEKPEVFIILMIAGIVLYILLNKYKVKWLVIPVAAAASVAIAAIFGLYPAFKTGIGLPIMNPNFWWNQKWGIGWGMNYANFIKAFPFAMLAIVMWPIDALAVKTFQETNYPKEAKHAIFEMNSTYILVSLRNLFGSLLGGSQISAVWRSFMIPLGTVKRPIGASAFILGLFGIGFGILGFPIDIAVFPPLLHLVLIFGVYIPLLEVGLSNIRIMASAQVAAICIVAGIAINPVVGWISAIFIENFNILKEPECQRNLTVKDRYLTIGLIIVTIITFLATYII
ncbi:MAG: DUF3360 domain-containing protein [Firmicutes bacterium]|nr:DUF3360 domain-containing protein [Bacillota bacterium]